MAVLGAVSLMAIVVGSVAGCGGGGATTDGGAGTGGGSAGTSGGGAGTGGPPGSPVAQCNEVVETYCARSVTCAAGTGTITKETCVRRFGVFVGCERATTAFTDCLKDVQSVSCSTLSAGPPASCRDPIGTIPLSTAQMKCFELAGVYCTWGAKCENVTLTAQDLQDCTDFYGDEWGCFFATDVVQACINDLPTASCTPPDGGAPDAGTPITPSCADPITIVE